MEHLKKINMSDREIMDGKNGIMCRESYGFRDPVVKNVVDKFVKRSDVGYKKYKGFGFVPFITLREIKKEEELFFNYKDTPGDNILNQFKFIKK